MPHNLRGKPVTGIGVTAGSVVSAVGCGLVSVVFAAVPGTASTLKIYDHASAATNEKLGFTAGSTYAASTCCFAPSKPLAFSNGIYIVVTGEDAKAYLEIEP